MATVFILAKFVIVIIQYTLAMFFVLTKFSYNDHFFIVAKFIIGMIQIDFAMMFFILAEFSYNSHIFHIGGVCHWYLAIMAFMYYIL